MAEPEYGTGRIYQEDPRDENYPARPLVASLTVPPKPRYHMLMERRDQGLTGTCVGFSWYYWESATPVRNLGDEHRPFDIYRKCIIVDEWTANDHEVRKPIDQLLFGTSVRAGAKVMQDEGRLERYHWAANALEAATFIYHYAGVVAGTAWQNEMFQTTAEGFIKPRYDRPFPYGHAYFYTGYDPKRGAFRGIMAWKNFGQGQRFWMAGEDVDRLHRMQGELCCPVERKIHE